MDSQDRDESKNRQREEALARRVGEALDQMNPHGAGDCPDSEVIAAYAEQALGPDESERWEGHFATCARCRKILRVLAASAETPLAEKEVAQLGELVSAIRGPVEIKGKSAGRTHPGFVDWRTRWPAAAGWLAPALGVAAVLAVWFAMRPPWRATNRGAPTTLIAQAPKEEVPLSPAPAEVDRLSRVAPQQDRKTQAAPLSDRSSENARSLNSSLGKLAKSLAESGNALEKAAPSADEAKSSLQPEKEKKLSAPANGREIQPPAIPPPPPPLPKAQAAMEAPAASQTGAKGALGTPASAPLPQSRAQSAAAGAAAPEVPASTNQSVVVTEAAPQVATANGTIGGTIQQGSSKDLPLNGRNYKALATLRPARGYSALLKATFGSTLWRAGKSGIIERSVDAGKTWVSQASPSQEDWLAGAAVSDTVCWVAGRNGAIARTLDGVRWEPISPPAQAAGTDARLPDWTGVTARDGQSATITASDGRKFSTLDGGKTWFPQ